MDIQEQAPTAPSTSKECDVAEQLALRRALKRTKLEQATKSPSVFRFEWTIFLIIGGGLLYFQDHLADYIWLIALLLFLQIQSASAAVHSRIDAIIELEKLRADTGEPIKTQPEQGAPSNGG